MPHYTLTTRCQTIIYVSIASLAHEQPQSYNLKPRKNQQGVKWPQFPITRAQEELICPVIV